MTPIPNRTIYLACDGFGQDLLNAVKTHLEQNHHVKVEDLGCDTYYDAAAHVSKAITKTHPKDGTSTSTSTNDERGEKLGMLFCGTGMGVGIVANKFAGIRAAPCENVTAARCARAVNDSNVLCIGQLVTEPEAAKKIVDEFLSQKFISQPHGEDGKPLSWWNGGVEQFLSTSMEGVTRVEQEALDQGIPKVSS
mmetsp:Transcript_2472/g.3719  ORF Transcript_2472/g.3719 Transcript_2472/m.3719 type:complete len:194 (+) Transcript_2472:34-615(+)